MSRSMNFAVGAMFVGCLSVVLTGCGGGGGGGGGTPRASATVLFDVGSDPGTRLFSFSRGVNPSEVDPNDIESLTLTLTEIIFLYEGPEDEFEEEDEAEHDHDRTVDVFASEFSPNSITIEVGHAVRWVWDANGLHTITSGSFGDPDAGALFDVVGDTAGEVVEIEFNEVGVFPYFSNVEVDIANAMSGTVIVVEDDDEGFEGESEEEPARGEGGEEAEDDDDLTHIVVFSGSMDIDILELTLMDVTELISEVSLPAGEYKGIRLSVENPRLVFKSDPATIIEDVHLTANGRLFIR